MPSFLEVLGHRKLSDVFADNTWVSIYDKSLAWLELPPKDFLDYCVSRPRLSFDGVPPDPNVFKNNPTFLICQAHRVWLTLKTIQRHLPTQDPVTILDLGAFPFVVDRGIKGYLGREAKIYGTVNQRIGESESQELREFGIELFPVNLDPLVEVTTPLEGMTNRIPLEDGSVDLVVFSHVIEHLYHPQMIIQEACRVLKKGGKLLLSTDNAFLIGGFLNYLTNGTYLHEPIEGTAAMVFTEWRGHVRFYSDADLRIMVERAGAQVRESTFYEVLYNSIWEEYFVTPAMRIPQWRVDLLTQFPEFRNEVMLVAEK